MRALLVLSVLALAAVALAEKRIQAHSCVLDNSCGIHDFAKQGKAQADKIVTVTLWTSQNNFAASCSSLLLEVSDPDSPKYGQHLSFEQIKALVYDRAALKAIHSFLDKHGIPQQSRDVAPNGEFVEVKAPVAQLEKMFSAEFHEFHSVKRNARIVRSHGYSIPTELVDFVTTIDGISSFPMYRKHAEIVSSPKRQSGPQPGGMYPGLIEKTYRLPNETDPTQKADMGVFEALGQSYDDSDLAAFQKEYGIPRQKVKKIIGPNNPGSCAGNPDNCVEATLDVEYIIAMAQGGPLTYWSIADENGDIFLEFAKAVAKTTTPPQVFSISYGGPEHLQNQADMTQFSTEVCKLGVRGLTIFVASGDDGVAGYEARDDPSQCGFRPEYPAAVPYVTTVGATMGPALVPARAEVVCQSNTNPGSIITSGGGFSEHFTQPSWQTNAVATYLSTGPNLPPKNQFNAKGRAYPDVASLGNAYNIIVGGQWFQVSGTSAASPVFCGMVTLINGIRETQGKQPVGFLNPILYKIDKSVYNDVVSGINNCCAKDSEKPVCCKYGFTAAKGWDPATGYGSIDYPLFANALSNL
jgi:tripeptidyl-peptidase-1